jgi:hypothetical protein
MRRHPDKGRAEWGMATALAAVVAAALVGAAGAQADDPGCPGANDAAYRMQLKALTGPAGADLTVTVDPVDEACAAPKELKKIRMKTFGEDGTLVSTRNVTDKAAPGGVANLDLGDLPRDRRIEAEVLVQTGTPERTHVLREATRTLLRPDLVVTKIVSPKQTLVGKPVTVKAVIAEENGDVGATANVRLSAIPGSAEPVEVPRGGEATVTFENVTFGTAVPVDMKLDVLGAAPSETDDQNNSRSVTIDVTEHALPTPRNVLFPSLVGYGAQFGNHVYAPITPWPSGLGYGDFEDKVKALEPQLVRIFYNDNWDGNADGKHPEWPENYASFVKVVQLAQASGATIDISYQNLGNARLTPEPSMLKFADVLEDLVRNHGLTNVLWAEVGNEPNSPGGLVTLEQYNALYRALNAQLVGRGLRGQIHLMGGGLVENAGSAPRNHYAWMKWIAANMADVVDAYAEHVYWIYNDSGRLEYRLRDTWHLMNEVLPPEQRKPTYMMEFGIRGLGTCGTKPAFGNLYYAADSSCPEIWRTNIAGFQQLWFDIDSAQLGVAGTSKWDAYWSRYDLSSVNNQLYWTIGPPTEGSPLTPTYYAESLLFHTTAPGWQIIGVDPWNSDDSSVPAYEIEGHTSNDQPEKELAAYAGPNGDLTVIGLDTNGRALNGVSPDAPASYSIGGLPPNTTFNLGLWNATGDGTTTVAAPVTTNDAGVARFDVPLQAAFALTTVPVS